ncbi:hypothetical protein [Haloarchaeobius baliensis]|uniref:hypothetical protein n=1 Tax=Haloarchaeobius baliensis TaxID=1670458 RepID=UPI003F882AFF
MSRTDWRRFAFVDHPVVTFSLLDFALTWGLWTLLFTLSDGPPPGPLVLWVVVAALVLRYGHRTLAAGDAWTAT